jgi:hypothetical protein
MTDLAPMLGVLAALVGIADTIPYIRHTLHGSTRPHRGTWLADQPIVATACVVAADLLGAAMMAPKAYRDPHSETLSTFALASLSGALATGAVGSADSSLLLYPSYLCLVNGAIALLIHERRRDVRGVRAVLAQADSRV